MNFDPYSLSLIPLCAVTSIVSVALLCKVLGEKISDMYLWIIIFLLAASCIPMLNILIASVTLFMLIVSFFMEFAIRYPLRKLMHVKIGDFLPKK